MFSMRDIISLFAFASKKRSFEIIISDVKNHNKNKNFLWPSYIMFKEKWKYQNLHEIKDSCILRKQLILMCA